MADFGGGDVDAIFAAKEVFEQDLEAKGQAGEVEATFLECWETEIGVIAAAGGEFRLSKVFMTGAFLAVALDSGRALDAGLSAYAEAFARFVAQGGRTLRLGGHGRRARNGSAWGGGWAQAMRRRGQRPELRTVRRKRRS